jgi:copper homeostasis protein
MTEQVLIEVCVDSVASAVAAERGGAQRVELCSDLLEGGITPSLGLLEAVRSRISIPLHSIIRPRGGDFCYSDDELRIMQRDIEVAKSAGVDGVVFGLLKASGDVDILRTRKFVQLSRPLPVTFHRAFDVSADLRGSLEAVCETGVDRILTSGGEQHSLRGIETIAELVSLAGERIKIMAGGGINATNVAQILEHTRVREIHVGLATPIESRGVQQSPRVLLGKYGGREYQRTQVQEENVRELKRVAEQALQKRRDALRTDR